MSEQTYARIVQAVILVVFVLGTLYADPAAPAFAQLSAKHDDRHISDCARHAGIAQARCYNCMIVNVIHMNFPLDFEICRMA